MAPRWPGPSRQRCRSATASPSRLDGLAEVFGHVAVGGHVQQDGAGVADQAEGPAGDDAGADDAGERVHPQPAEGAGEQQADDHQHRDGGVGHDVDDGGAHVVVAMRGAVRVLRVRQRRRVSSPRWRPHREGMGFGDFVDRFKKAGARGKAKTWLAPSGRMVSMVPAASARRSVPRRRKRGGTPSSKISSGAVPALVGDCVRLRHRRGHGRGRGLVMVVAAAAEQPGAGDVHDEAEAGDGDRLGEMDRHRGEEAGRPPRSR